MEKLKEKAGFDALLNKRRSVRQYQPRLLSGEMIQQLVRAASQTPSPSNSQPVRVFQLASRESRTRLQQAMRDGYERLLWQRQEQRLPKRLNNWLNAYWRFSEFMFTAPLVLAVGRLESVDGFKQKLETAGLITSSFNSPELELTTGLAVQNILLKATEMGLGSCILTAPLVFAPFPETLMGLSGVRLSCFLTLGYPLRSSVSQATQPPDHFFTTL